MHIFTYEKYDCLILDFSNMYVSYYANVHSKMSLFSTLKDHVTLLNLFNLCGFCYPSVIFFMCRLKIVKIGNTTNTLYKPRFDADGSRDCY